MNWKSEYKSNLWSDCLAKNHLPVVVATSGNSVNLYCWRCKKVWRLAITGKLQSLPEDDLSSLEDSIWKRKVLSLMALQKDLEEEVARL